MELCKGRSQAALLGERHSPCKSPAKGLGLLCPGDFGGAEALNRNEQGAEWWEEGQRHGGGGDSLGLGV